MRPRALLFAALLAAPAVARAGDVTVVLKDQRGAPVADAVVTLSYPGGRAPARYAQLAEMGQKDLMFTPFVLVVPVGAEVKFNNEDKVRHHVYSFSPAKKFELKLFGRDQSHSVRFDKAGTVALGCNIHDSMVAFIRVVDAPMAVKTDASGRAVLHDVPGGAVTATAWQPYLRGPDNQVVATIDVPRSGSVEHDFTAPVIAPRH